MKRRPRMAGRWQQYVRSIFWSSVLLASLTIIVLMFRSYSSPLYYATSSGAQYSIHLLGSDGRFSFCINGKGQAGYISAINRMPYVEKLRSRRMAIMRAGPPFGNVSPAEDEEWAAMTKRQEERYQRLMCEALQDAIAEAAFQSRNRGWLGMWIESSSGSLGCHVVSLPIPILIAVFAIAPSLCIVQLVRRRRRSPDPLCEECGYNITSNSSGICPECGRSITESGLRRVIDSSTNDGAPIDDQRPPMNSGRAPMNKGRAPMNNDCAPIQNDCLSMNNDCSSMHND